MNFLIKPASGSCNMRCKYCFYADETSLRQVPSYGMMTDETMRALLKTGLENAKRECTFAFQGGEPTLIGLEFFRRLVAEAKVLNIRGIHIQYAIQTNGMLIDDEWAAFFKEHRFLVGLSLDGTKEIHDAYRPKADLSGSFSTVLKAAKTLEKHGVDFNILTVVTRTTARHIEKIYRFFMKNGLSYQQYIPCLDPLEEARGGQEYSLRPQDYAQFLKKLFDVWYTDITGGKQIYIRYFENLLGIMLGRHPEMCGLAGRCSPQYVVEADGGIYPCDFYVLDEYLIGNVNTDGPDAVMENLKKLQFIEKSAQPAPQCLSCQFAALCRGGCRRDRDYAGEDALGTNYFCPAYKEFFAYAAPRLQQIARQIRNQSPL